MFLVSAFIITYILLFCKSGYHQNGFVAAHIFPVGIQWESNMYVLNHNGSMNYHWILRNLWNKL